MNENKINVDGAQSHSDGEAKHFSDGSIRFSVSLPGKLAKVFLRYCEEDERGMSDMARYIIKQHFRRLAMKHGVEEYLNKKSAAEFSREEEIPKFSGESALRDAADGE